MARKNAAAVSLGKRRMEQLTDAERTDFGALQNLPTDALQKLTQSI
jgi:hypothetical protein